MKINISRCLKWFKLRSDEYVYSYNTPKFTDCPSKYLETS